MVPVAVPVAVMQPGAPIAVVQQAPIAVSQPPLAVAQPPYGQYRMFFFNVFYVFMIHFKYYWTKWVQLHVLHNCNPIINRI